MLTGWPLTNIGAARISVRPNGSPLFEPLISNNCSQLLAEDPIRPLGESDAEQLLLLLLLLAGQTYCHHHVLFSLV